MDTGLRRHGGLCAHLGLKFQKFFGSFFQKRTAFLPLLFFAAFMYDRIP
jgi:hypothetical protein